MVSIKHIYLYKKSKILFSLEKKKFFDIFFFKILVHFYRFKSQLTQKIANYRKFPLEWLILSTKMIKKWPPFAYTCLYKKKVDKKLANPTSVHWHIVVRGSRLKQSFLWNKSSHFTNPSLTQIEMIDIGH